MSEEKKTNKKLKALIVLVTAISLIFVLANLVFNDFFLYKSYDFLVKNIGGKKSKPHKDIVLLLIDEATLRYGANLGTSLGRWPWPRNIYPEILSYINSSDPPKSIIFDIFFTEPDLTEGNDAALAQEVLNSGNICQNVLLQYNPERKDALKIPEDVKRNFQLTVENPENIKFEKSVANEFSMPLPCLRSQVSCFASDDDARGAEASAMGLAIASFSSEQDGIYRRGRILFNYGKTFFPSFSLLALMAYADKSKVKVLPGNVIQVGKYKIPVDSNGKYIANYYDNKLFKVYSMSALMVSAYHLERGEAEKITVRPDEFKDKIVIIGCSAPGCKDLKNSPMHENTPGPLIHANMISNILQQNHIVYEKSFVTYILMFLIILISIASIIFIESLIYRILIQVGIVSIYVAINLFVFNTFNYLSPLLFIIVTGLVSMGISYIYLSMTEGAEKRKYSKILGNMVDPQIVSEALIDLEALKKGGEKNITAFFSDIASFSTISEKLNSVDLAALLNEYLSAMTIILKQHRGTLDKYIGDAVVGIFGAPIDMPDNALPSARASLEMIEELEVLRKKWVDENAYCREAREMRFRIGLNTGHAKVGFMGTDELASYTMMGDTVNLAARLEAAGKDYGVDILVSESTNELIKSEMFLRKLDAVTVKGKSQPVLIYELIGRQGEIPENILKSTKIYEDAFEKYQQMKWDEAISLFKKSLDLRGKPDKAIDMLVDRCEYYKSESPGDAWDGVFVRKHK